MRVRVALSVGVALSTSTCACACAEVATEPRAAEPAVRDTFPEQFDSLQQAPPPPPRRVQSVSLGFIGDSPIGTEPTPPVHLPYWERPFPCHWTGTCWLVPPPPVYYPPCAAVWVDAPLPQ